MSALHVLCRRQSDHVNPLLHWLRVSERIRHQAIDDVIARVISSSGTPVTKEPAGLTRLDGKRPDWLTLIPWHGS